MNFRKKLKPELPTFQMAPMIDCIFLLLCFFVASQIYAQWETELNIKLPVASKSTIPERLPGEIIINITKDGTVVVNKQVLSDEDLLNILERIAELFKGQPVLIRADGQTDFEHVVKVLDYCKKADIWNVSFATTPTAAETKR